MSLAPQKLAPFSALDLDGAERRLRSRRLGTLELAAPWLRRARRRSAHAIVRLKRLLARYRRRPLTLELVDGTVTFRSLAEFDFALSSKTEFPVAKVPELMERRAEEIRRVATHIRQVEKRFAQALTESIREPAFIGELLREMEIRLFSNDHGWRDLVDALNAHGPEFDAHKKLVLVKYMQYLASRQDVLRSLYLDKTRDRDALSSAAYAEPPELPMSAAREVSLHDTAIFEQTAPSADSEEVFATLPRGETMSVRINGEPLVMQLAGHRFELHGEPDFHLVDEVGERYPIGPGKNLVGRSTAADIVVSGWLRGVSRRHLLVEPVSEDTVLITDVSSHGTAVPEHLLD